MVSPQQLIVALTDISLRTTMHTNKYRTDVAAISCHTHRRVIWAHNLGLVLDEAKTPSNQFLVLSVIIVLYHSSSHYDHIAAATMIK